MGIHVGGALAQFIRGWRVLVVIGFFALGWVITFIVFWIFRETIDQPSLWHEIFVAWTGELLFFTIVGLAVTIVSLERPRDPRTENWRDRVRNLFGLSTVPECVAEFHRQSIEQIARYATNVRREIIIEEYDSTVDAYRVNIKQDFIIRNALHDTELTEKLPFRVEPDNIALGPDRYLGRVFSVVIGGSEKIQTFTPIPAQGFSTDFMIPLRPGAEVAITVRYEVWMKANVPQRQRSVRFVESMEIVFVSHVVHNVEVNVTGDGRGPLTLLPNQPFPPYIYNATEPRSLIIEYSFRPP